MYDYYSGSFSYEAEKIKMRFGASAGITNYYETDFSTPSRRSVYNINAGTEIVKNFVFYLEGGASPYTDLLIPDNNYSENYLYAKVTYNFAK
jgi:hypothetical protein